MPTIMTLDEVRKRVEDIGDPVTGRQLLDDETAHGREDELHLDLLRAIAEERCESPIECAAEAIKTAKINFERWAA